MELKEVVRAVRGGWWLVTLGVLLAVAVAGLVTWQTKPRYASTMTLFVAAAGTDDTATAYQGNLFSQQRVASYVQMFRGEAFVTPIAQQLSLTDTPADLINDIQATTIPDTVLIDVTVTRNSPTEARDIAAALGKTFTARVAELETPDGGVNSTVKVTVSEPPQVARAPVSPQPLRNVAGGVVLGLLLGLSAAILRVRLDNTVKASDDFMELAGTNLVGTLAEDPSLRDHHLVSDEDGYSETGEAYRQMRTNLQFLNVDDPARTIVITSALPGEGKTTVSVNLAVVLARSGARVALIEADLRRPRVTRYLGMISGAGLSNVLAGTARAEELLQPYGDGNLQVLAAGPMPPNPSEMLGSRHMQALLKELREHHDYVLIDAPPVLPVTDGAVLSVAADGALLVIRHGVTTRAQVRQASESLHRIEARLLGTVINRVPVKAAEGYGYGYGYSYSAVSDLTGELPAIRDGGAPGRRGSHRTDPTPAGASARK